MSEYTIQIDLLSDTAFGRGDGVAGLVDSEIEHDMQTGLPFVKGRTVKGLIVEECANILYALSNANRAGHDKVYDIAKTLFGIPGSTADVQGKLSFGNATMPADFVAFVQQKLQEEEQAIEQSKLEGKGYIPAYSSQSVLNALTAIRYQTAVDREKDVPLENSLRATRVLRRENSLMAPVHCEAPLTADEECLLVACLAATRRAGQNRTRGLGRIQMTLLDSRHKQTLQDFAKLIGG